MALSAASPAFQGTLADVDCRWDVIAGSVDDRTPGESGTGVCMNSVYLSLYCGINFTDFSLWGRG